MSAGLTELLGYAAAGLVLATFSARSITALRVLAIASNVLFIAYATSAHLPPILILHALLLPINLVRLRQALADQRRIRATPDRAERVRAVQHANGRPMSRGGR